MSNEKNHCNKEAGCSGDHLCWCDCNVCVDIVLPGEAEDDE